MNFGTNRVTFDQIWILKTVTEPAHGKITLSLEGSSRSPFPKEDFHEATTWTQLDVRQCKTNSCNPHINFEEAQLHVFIYGECAMMLFALKPPTSRSE
eukprot:3929382-Amphidinium_carterae.1